MRVELLYELLNDINIILVIIFWVAEWSRRWCLRHPNLPSIAWRLLWQVGLARKLNNKLRTIFFEFFEVIFVLLQ